MEQHSLFQGSSTITKIKEAQIYGVIKTRLSQRKFQDYINRIHVYDIFSGDGINVVEGQPIWGSPVETINAIVDSEITKHIKVIFTASDNRQSAIDVLQNRIGDIKCCPIICKKMDAAKQIAEISSVLRMNPKDHAIVLIDPNGPGTLPFQEMKEFARRYNKRADILLNISETAMNRILGCSVTKDKNWWATFDNFSNIVCDIFESYRQTWVRDVVKGDKQRWRFICFWGWGPTRGGWEKQGIYSISTKYGIKSLLDKGVKNETV